MAQHLVLPVAENPASCDQVRVVDDESLLSAETILEGRAFADIRLQHCKKGIPVLWVEQRRTLFDARFGV